MPLSENDPPLSVAIVGGYPMYRLGLVNLLQGIDEHLTVLELNSITDLMALRQVSQTILFFSFQERMAYIASQKATAHPVPYTVIFTPCMSEPNKRMLEQADNTLVLPLSVSLPAAEKYLGRLLIENDASVGRDMLKDVELQALFLPDFESLTHREKEVMRHISAGLDNDRIAEEMSIEKNTVKVFIGKIYKKTGVFNRTQAACLFNAIEFSNV